MFGIVCFEELIYASTCSCGREGAYKLVALYQTKEEAEANVKGVMEELNKRHDDYSIHEDPKVVEVGFGLIDASALMFR